MDIEQEGFDLSYVDYANYRMHFGTDVVITDERVLFCLGVTAAVRQHVIPHFDIGTPKMWLTHT